MKFLTTVLLVVLLIAALESKPIEAAAAPKLPLTTVNSTWRPLSRLRDPGFQAQLDRALKQNPLRRSLLKREKLAVGLVDLSVPESPRFAELNGHVMMYGASLPKLAILLAAFQDFEDGSLKETPAMKADLIWMIRVSDNAAAGRMVSLIGLKKIENLLLAPRYRFYDPARGGGLWLGSGYTRGSEWHPDPIKGLTQAATVYQLCRFYYLLAYGRLINPERSRQMLAILSSPELNDKFVQVLEPEVPLRCLHRKSGEWRSWHSDSVLVWAEQPWRRYILVGMVDNRRGNQVLKGLVPMAEHLLEARETLSVVDPNRGFLK